MAARPVGPSMSVFLETFMDYASFFISGVSIGICSAIFLMEFDMAKYRKKMSKRGGKRYFSATASKTHRKNVISRAGLQRGGIRL